MSNALVIYERRVDQARLDKLSDSLGVKHLDANQLGYIQERPVTWENEPARHKLLDIIGDMALIGRPLKGRIIAIRPGHEANNKFARLVRSKLLIPNPLTPTPPMISPLAFVHPEPKSAKNCEIGPFCYIDANVELGDNNRLMNSVTLLSARASARATPFSPVP